MSEELDLLDSLKSIETKSKYINPRTDFAFKHFFGKEPNKDLLKDFLNGIFKGRKVITDLVFNNPEHKGILPTFRKTVFDLYCTGNDGQKFIVEVQQAKRDFFKDRIIFYTANLIQEQGISVNSDWNYKLPEVYFIAIMDFSFDDSDPSHYEHDVRLVDINTNREFYNKLGYIFIELPKFMKIEAELKSKEDDWLFSLKNMNKLKEIPVSLSKKKEFVKLFKIAEVSNLNPDEMNAYQESLKVQRDNFSLNETIKRVSQEEGHKIGHKIGLEIGLEKGALLERARALEEKKQIARNLRNKEIPLDIIAEATGLSIKEIEAL